jgi:hypothetical protein
MDEIPVDPKKHWVVLPFDGVTGGGTSVTPSIHFDMISVTVDHHSADKIWVNLGEPGQKRGVGFTLTPETAVALARALHNPEPAEE